MTRFLLFIINDTYVKEAIPVPASNKIKNLDANSSQNSDTQFCGVHQWNHRAEHPDWICNARQQSMSNFHRCAV